MHWSLYETFYNLICKIKKTTNKIIKYLFENYWDDNDELNSKNFIVEVFKGFMFYINNLNFEGKVEYALDDKNLNEIHKKELIRFYEKLAEDEIKALLKSNKENNIKNKRNGYRTRIVQSIYGELKLRIPVDRLRLYFPSFLQRRFRYLSDVIQLLFNNLKVTQNQSQCIRELKNNGIYASRYLTRTVVNIFFKRVEPIYNLRKFPEYLDAIMLDGTYVKVLENGETITLIDPVTGEKYEFRACKTVCVIQAYGIIFENKEVVMDKKHPEKIKKIIYKKIDLGFMICDKEDKFNYANFLYDIKEKGVRKIKILMADKHPAIKEAMELVFPDYEDFQFCTAHAKRVVQKMVCTKEDKNTIDCLFKLFPSELSEKEIKDILPKYIETFSLDMGSKEKIYKWFIENWDNIFAFRKYPKSAWRTIYTTNYVESMNRRIKLKEKMKGFSYDTKTLHKNILISKAIWLKLI